MFCTFVNFKNDLVLAKIMNTVAMKSKLKTCLGTFCCVLFVFFITLSIPIFVFRKVVVLLAKAFRSDFGNILNGQSALLVRDYLTSTIPRSNCVVVFTIQGHLTLEEVKTRVLSNWIKAQDESGGKLKYENFQRYPAIWLGYAFWKDASLTFDIDKHVGKLSTGDSQVTDMTLSEIVETLLNQQFPRRQSPWQLFVIENYAQLSVDTDVDHAHAPHSVLVLKYHHCLADGVGIMTAVVNGLFRQSWTRPPAPLQPKITLCRRLGRSATYPVLALLEMSYFFSHLFRSCSFKIPDERKEWHQVYARTGPIPIQVIKDIKNALGVSYASVLLSAVSAAVHKTLMDTENARNKVAHGKSMLCLSMLPPVGVTKRKTLTNQFTAAVFDLPTASFKSPFERLLSVNCVVERSKTSVIPMLAQFISGMVGAHSYYFGGFMTKNRTISLGLSSFAAAVHDIQWDTQRKCIRTESISGAHYGQAGISVSAVSHGKQVGIQMCAEKAVLTRQQAETFVRYIKEEIYHLLSSIPERIIIE